MGKIKDLLGIKLAQLKHRDLVRREYNADRDGWIDDSFDSWSDEDHAEYQAWIDSWDSWE